MRSLTVAATGSLLLRWESEMLALVFHVCAEFNGTLKQTYKLGHVS